VVFHLMLLLEMLLNNKSLYCTVKYSMHGSLRNLLILIMMITLTLFLHYCSVSPRSCRNTLERSIVVFQTMQAEDVLQTSFEVSPLIYNYNSQGPHRFQITLIPWYFKLSRFLWPNRWRLTCSRKGTSFTLLCPYFQFQADGKRGDVYHANTI